MPRLKSLAEEALHLLNPPAKGRKIAFSKRFTASQRADVHVVLRQLLESVNAELDKLGDDVELIASVELRVPKGEE